MCLLDRQNSYFSLSFKGQMVYAEGAPEAEGYTNKDGNVAATLRMRVQNIQLLGGKNENPGGQPQVGYANSNAGNVSNSGHMAQPTARTPMAAADMPLDDDLPF